MQVRGRRGGQRFGGYFAGFSIAILVSAGSAFAQNQGTFEQQEACKPDVFRLCSQYIPDADRITACLRDNEPQLSPPCHDVFFPPQAEEPKKKETKKKAKPRSER